MHKRRQTRISDVTYVTCVTTCRKKNRKETAIYYPFLCDGGLNHTGNCHTHYRSTVGVLGCVSKLIIYNLLIYHLLLHTALLVYRYITETEGLIYIGINRQETRKVREISISSKVRSIFEHEREKNTESRRRDRKPRIIIFLYRRYRP